MRKNSQSNTTNLYLVSGIVLLSLGGAYYKGYHQAHKTHNENIISSNVAQEITSLALKNTKVDALMDAIKTKVQLSLVEQSGVSNIKLEKHDQEWNKFLTKSEVDVSVEFNILVGIDTSDLFMVKNDDKLIIQYNRDHLKAISYEVLNENILSSRNIFSKGYSDDEKIAIKKHLKEQALEQVMSDDKIIKTSMDALEDYLYGLADSFDVKIDIIAQ